MATLVVTPKASAVTPLDSCSISNQSSQQKSETKKSQGCFQHLFGCKAKGSSSSDSVEYHSKNDIDDHLFPSRDETCIHYLQSAAYNLETTLNFHPYIKTSKSAKRSNNDKPDQGQSIDTVGDCPSSTAYNLMKELALWRAQETKKPPNSLALLLAANNFRKLRGKSKCVQTVNVATNIQSKHVANFGQQFISTTPQRSIGIQCKYEEQAGAKRGLAEQNSISEHACRTAVATNWPHNWLETHPTLRQPTSHTSSLNFQPANDQESRQLRKGNVSTCTLHRKPSQDTIKYKLEVDFQNDKFKAKHKLASNAQEKMTKKTNREIEYSSVDLASTEKGKTPISTEQLSRINANKTYDLNSPEDLNSLMEVFQLSREINRTDASTSSSQILFAFEPEPDLSDVVKIPIESKTFSGQTFTFEHESVLESSVKASSQSNTFTSTQFTPELESNLSDSVNIPEKSKPSGSHALCTFFTESDLREIDEAIGMLENYSQTHSIKTHQSQSYKKLQHRMKHVHLSPASINVCLRSRNQPVFTVQGFDIDIGPATGENPETTLSPTTTPVKTDNSCTTTESEVTCHNVQSFDRKKSMHRMKSDASSSKASKMSSILETTTPPESSLASLARNDPPEKQEIEGPSRNLVTKDVSSSSKTMSNTKVNKSQSSVKSETYSTTTASGSVEKVLEAETLARSSFVRNLLSQFATGPIELLSIQSRSIQDDPVCDNNPTKSSNSKIEALETLERKLTILDKNVKKPTHSKLKVLTNDCGRKQLNITIDVDDVENTKQLKLQRLTCNDKFWKEVELESKLSKILEAITSEDCFNNEEVKKEMPFTQFGKSYVVAPVSNYQKTAEVEPTILDNKEFPSEGNTNATSSTEEPSYYLFKSRLRPISSSSSELRVPIIIPKTYVAKQPTPKYALDDPPPVLKKLVFKKPESEAKLRNSNNRDENGTCDDPLHLADVKRFLVNNKDGLEEGTSSFIETTMSRAELEKKLMELQLKSATVYEILIPLRSESSDILLSADSTIRVSENKSETRREKRQRKKEEKRLKKLQLQKEKAERKEMKALKRAQPFKCECQESQELNSALKKNTARSKTSSKISVDSLSSRNSETRQGFRNSKLCSSKKKVGSPSSSKDSMESSLSNTSSKLSLKPIILRKPSSKTSQRSFDRKVSINDRHQLESSRSRSATKKNRSKTSVNGSISTGKINRTCSTETLCKSCIGSIDSRTSVGGRKALKGSSAQSVILSPRLVRSSSSTSIFLRTVQEEPTRCGSQNSNFSSKSVSSSNLRTIQAGLTDPIIIGPPLTTVGTSPSTQTVNAGINTSYSNLSPNIDKLPKSRSASSMCSFSSSNKKLKLSKPSSKTKLVKKSSNVFIKPPEDRFQAGLTDPIIIGPPVTVGTSPSKQTVNAGINTSYVYLSPNIDKLPKSRSASSMCSFSSTDKKLKFSEPSSKTNPARKSSNVSIKSPEDRFQAGLTDPIIIGPPVTVGTSPSRQTVDTGINTSRSNQSCNSERLTKSGSARSINSISSSCRKSSKPSSKTTQARKASNVSIKSPEDNIGASSSKPKGNKEKSRVYICRSCSEKSIDRNCIKCKDSKTKTTPATSTPEESSYRSKCNLKCAQNASELLKRPVMCNKDDDCPCKCKTFIITTKALEKLIQNYDLQRAGKKGSKSSMSKIFNLPKCRTASSSRINRDQAVDTTKSPTRFGGMCGMFSRQSQTYYVHVPTKFFFQGNNMLLNATPKKESGKGFEETRHATRHLVCSSTSCDRCNESELYRQEKQEVKKALNVDGSQITISNGACQNARKGLIKSKMPFLTSNPKENRPTDPTVVTAEAESSSFKPTSATSVKFHSPKVEIKEINLETENVDKETNLTEFEVILNILSKFNNLPSAPYEIIITPNNYKEDGSELDNLVTAAHISLVKLLDANSNKSTRKSMDVALPAHLNCLNKQYKLFVQNETVNEKLIQLANSYDSYRVVQMCSDDNSNMADKAVSNMNNDVHRTSLSKNVSEATSLSSDFNLQAEKDLLSKIRKLVGKDKPKCVDLAIWCDNKINMTDKAVSSMDNNLHRTSLSRKVCEATSDEQEERTLLSEIRQLLDRGKAKSIDLATSMSEFNEYSEIENPNSNKHVLTSDKSKFYQLLKSGFFHSHHHSSSRTPKYDNLSELKLAQVNRKLSQYMMVSKSNVLNKSVSTSLPDLSVLRKKENASVRSKTTDSFTQTETNLNNSNVPTCTENANLSPVFYKPSSWIVASECPEDTKKTDVDFENLYQLSQDTKTQRSRQNQTVTAAKSCRHCGKHLNDKSIVSEQNPELPTHTQSSKIASQKHVEKSNNTYLSQSPTIYSKTRTPVQTTPSKSFCTGILTDPPHFECPEGDKPNILVTHFQESGLHSLEDKKQAQILLTASTQTKVPKMKGNQITHCLSHHRMETKSEKSLLDVKQKANRNLFHGENSEDSKYSYTHYSSVQEQNWISDTNSQVSTESKSLEILQKVIDESLSRCSEKSVCSMYNIPEPLNGRHLVINCKTINSPETQNRGNNTYKGGLPKSSTKIEPFTVTPATHDFVNDLPSSTETKSHRANQEMYSSTRSASVEKSPDMFTVFQKTSKNPRRVNISDFSILNLLSDYISTVLNCQGANSPTFLTYCKNAMMNSNALSNPPLKKLSLTRSNTAQAIVTHNGTVPPTPLLPIYQNQTSCLKSLQPAVLSWSQRCRKCHRVISQEGEPPRKRKTTFVPRPLKRQQNATNLSAAAASSKLPSTMPKSIPEESDSTEHSNAAKTAHFLNDHQPRVFNRIEFTGIEFPKIIHKRYLTSTEDVAEDSSSKLEYRNPIDHATLFRRFEQPERDDPDIKDFLHEDQPNDEQSQDTIASSMSSSDHSSSTKLSISLEVPISQLSRNKLLELKSITPKTIERKLANMFKKSEPTQNAVKLPHRWNMLKMIRIPESSSSGSLELDKKSTYTDIRAPSSNAAKENTNKEVNFIKYSKLPVLPKNLNSHLPTNNTKNMTKCEKFNVCFPMYKKNENVLQTANCDSDDKNKLKWTLRFQLD